MKVGGVIININTNNRDDGECVFKLKNVDARTSVLFNQIVESHQYNVHIKAFMREMYL